MCRRDSVLLRDSMKLLRMVDDKQKFSAQSANMYLFICVYFFYGDVITKRAATESHPYSRLSRCDLHAFQDHIRITCLPQNCTASCNACLSSSPPSDKLHNSTSKYGKTC